MAIKKEGHHLRRVIFQVEADHVFVELLRFRRWYADSVNASRHQYAVHDEAGGSLVTIKEKSLKSAE